jgi:hypothetical protein
VNAIGRRVDDIVQRVNRSREEAEDGKGPQGRLDDRRMGEMLREHDGRQDEDVLHPLVRPQRSDHPDDERDGAVARRLGRGRGLVLGRARVRLG